MKYIKKFENTGIKRYWKIPTERNKYIAALEYLGVPNNPGGLYDCNLSNTNKYIFVSQKDNHFFWSSLDNERWLIENDYETMGVIDDSILNANKYNL